MKQLTTNIALLFLGVCILTGSWLVSNALNTNSSERTGEQVSVNMNTPQERQLLNHLELKEYLGISDEQLERILPRKDGDVIQSNIPYIKIGYEYYFPVKAIDKWLTETEAETFE